MTGTCQNRWTNPNMESHLWKKVTQLSLALAGECLVNFISNWLNFPKLLSSYFRIFYIKPRRRKYLPLFVDTDVTNCYILMLTKANKKWLFLLIRNQWPNANGVGDVFCILHRNGLHSGEAHYANYVSVIATDSLLSVVPIPSDKHNSLWLAIVDK